MNITKAKVLANEKLQEWGLADKGWTFAYDKAVRRFGCCKPSKKQITLSRVLTKKNNTVEVTDTILHEIAHALDYEDRGTSDHSAKWKAWARKVGARPERCYGDEVTAAEYRYYYYCSSCNSGTGRHKRTTAKSLMSCSKCSHGRFNLKHLMVPNVTPEQFKALKAGEMSVSELPQINKLKKKVADRYGQATADKNNVVGSGDTKAAEPAPKETKTVRPAAKTKQTASTGKTIFGSRHGAQTEAIDNVFISNDGTAMSAQQIADLANEARDDNMTAGRVRNHIRSLMERGINITKHEGLYRYDK